MTELKNVLIKQLEKYPAMQITDIFKLIFQNEFAGGHMVSNEQRSMNLLEEEMKNVKDNMYFEHIGNDLCRLYLGDPDKSSLDISTINKFFVNTSNIRLGSVESFETKLEILKQLCKDKLIHFDANDIKNEIACYKLKNYPAVSHSQIYRDAYDPHYRVVDKAYQDFVDIFQYIDTTLKFKESILIAIDGSSASGKTSLGKFLKEVYDCNIFQMDDFFLQPSQRTPDRLNEVGGNVDYIRFKEQIIDNIKNIGTKFFYDKYDCQTRLLTKSKEITTKRLNIVEGVYSQHPMYSQEYDFKICLHIKKEEQYNRILNRNGKIMLERFKNEWIPMEDNYFKKTAIIEESDLVVDTTNIHIPLGN